MSFTRPFLLIPVFFHLERGWMPLHDAVGVRGARIWAEACMLDDCVCYLT